MSLKRILIATKNKGKLDEIKGLLAGMDIELFSLRDLSMKDDVVEDGRSYEENALKKANAAAYNSGLIAISDDSGLEVEILNGAPGIFSSRFAGDGLTDKDRNIRLIDIIKDKKASMVENVAASYVCVAAIVNPVNGKRHIFRGCCKGRIIMEPIGETGFGYDPIFFMPEYGKTFAEIGSEIKNRISHRAKAFLGVREYLLSVSC